MPSPSTPDAAREAAWRRLWTVLLAPIGDNDRTADDTPPRRLPDDDSRRPEPDDREAA